MEKFAYKVSLFFLRKGYISENQVEDIRFSVEVVISNLVSFLSIIVLGITINQVTKTIIFLSVFIGFRLIKDRFHADTFAKCYCLTVGSFLMSVIISSLIDTNNQKNFTVYVNVLNLVIYTIFFEDRLFDSSKRSDRIFKYAYIIYIFCCLMIGLICSSNYGPLISVLGSIVLFTVIANPKN